MTNKNLNRFCYCKNIYSAPEIRTWAQIKELMQSALVVNTCKKIAALNPDAPDYQ